MRPDDLEAERLNDAVDALLRGEAHDGAGMLPVELAALVAAAERLASAGGTDPSAPRPSFVLGLEEQLRTELRMETVRRSARRSGLARPIGLAIVAVLGVGLLAAGIERAGPSSPLRPLQQELHAARVFLGFSSAGRADALLDYGWRDVMELTRLVSEGHLTRGALAALLAELDANYSNALREAARTADGRVARRAAMEARDAAAALAALARRTVGPDAALLAASQEELEAHLLALGPPGIVAVSPAVAGATTVAVVIVPATASPAATPSRVAPSDTPEPPTVEPTSTTAPPVHTVMPTATAILVSPSVTPQRVIERTKVPTRSHPTMTALPRPTDTARPPNVPPTRTPDIWATDTPPAPTEPSPRPSPEPTTAAGP